MFKEYSSKAEGIMREFELILRLTTLLFGTSFKSPISDVARRFLFELREFEPANKREKGRIGNA